MLKVIATAVTPIVLVLLAPLGINEATPVGEAILLIIVGGGTGVIAWFAQRSHRQD